MERAPDGTPPFRLTDRQQQVWRALTEKRSDLADLYECAVRALGSTDMSARLCMAAHCIREMMSDLPKVQDVPISSQGQLNKMIHDLQEPWEDARKGACYNDGRWLGTIDKPVQDLLRKLGEILKWHRANRPTRRSAAAAFFQNSDPAGRLEIQTARAAAWLELQDYFTGVSHRKITTEQELFARLERLEALLMDALYQQPSVDLRAIDDILREARNG